MKGFKLIIAFLLSICFFNTNVVADNKSDDSSNVVKVYLITKEGCPGCEAALEYFNKLVSDNPDGLELIQFEVFDKDWQWNSDDLKTLFYKVYEYFDEDDSKAATPTIIIGDYFTTGLASDKSEIEKAISDNKKDNKDAIKIIAKENNLNIDDLRYKNTSDKKEEKNYDALIVTGIFVVLIGGFVGLVFLGKK